MNTLFHYFIEGVIFGIARFAVYIDILKSSKDMAEAASAIPQARQGDYLFIYTIQVVG